MSDACSHPIVFEIEVSRYGKPRPDLGGGKFHGWLITARDRVCLLCGVHYDRTAFLSKLREAIADRHRIKSKRLTLP